MKTTERNEERMTTTSRPASPKATIPLTVETNAGLTLVGNGFPHLGDSNQPAELSDEQLGQVVTIGFMNLTVFSEKLKPYFFELRERFHKKPLTAEIQGCRTWDEFCTKVLKHTRRAVNYLLAGGNPASKRKSQSSGTGRQSTEGTPAPENGKPSFAIANSPIDGDPAWAKQQASQQILAWSDSCLKNFRPAEKREIAEDVIAKLRDVMEFEAPRPPRITSEPVPEPEPGMMEELRQRMLHMADVRAIGDALGEYVTELLKPLLMHHPYVPLHTVRVSVRRKDRERIAVNDWVECTSVGPRLDKLIGKLGLGLVVGMDELQRRPKIRWHNGQKWTKPYSFFGTDGSVRVLFDWQAAERHPTAFNAYISGKTKKQGG